MTKKMVCYNGGTKSNKECTDPRGKLEVRKNYQVLEEVKNGEWQLDYILEGIEGQFNSAWFYDVVEKNNISIVWCFGCVPEIGKNYYFKVPEFDNGKIKFTEIFTNPIKTITSMGNNIYYATTDEWDYIVQVVNLSETGQKNN